MATIAKMSVALSMDASDFEQGVKGAQNAGENLVNKLGKIGGAMTAGITLPIIGVAAAAGVAVAVLIAITLTPAILAMAGMKILSKKQRARLAGAGAGVGAAGGADGGSAQPAPKKSIKSISSTQLSWLCTGLCCIYSLVPTTYSSMEIATASLLNYPYIRYP